MTTKAVLLACIPALLGGVLAAQGAPGSSLFAAGGFGPNEQALHIGAAAFTPIDTDTVYHFSSLDGYLYHDVGPERFAATLHLPAGAEIFQICLYAYDDYPPISTVWVELEAVKLAPGGQPAGVVAIPNTLLLTSFDIGYGVTCSPPFSYIFRDTEDVDGDGQVEHVAHRVLGRIQVDGASGALGGVRVFWRRQISPAPPAATFADVPTGHGLFQFIEALAASGITAGCGGGNYCPDSPLTRGQMAAFLAKALGLYWPY